jgi:hypothetical protein
VDPVAGAAPALLAGHRLTEDERGPYLQLRKQLNRFAKINKDREAAYEGSQKVRHLDIAVPPNLKDVGVVAGWAGTAIDVIEERLNWDGFTSSGDLMGLDELYRANELDVEAPLAQLDTLIAGTAFVTVGKGDAGEPDILVTAESPSDCTTLWDYRRRMDTAGLSRTVGATGRVEMETLYLPGKTISLQRTDDGRMVVVDRDQTNRDRIPVARLINRARTSRKGGRSELTGAVRYLTDAAVRTLLGMEVNREFYTTPQRWLMGADMSVFTDEDGNQVSAWEAVAGHMLSMPRPFDPETETYGELPQVGQFTAAPPEPYIAQVRAYSMLLAAEVGIPASYLGYATDNPASADAIRAGETRLIQRSLRRQRGFTQGWRQVAYNALLWRDGKVDLDKLSKVQPNWDNPATPTPQAAADEATKLITSGVLLPDSDITYQRVGLTALEREQLTTEKRRARATRLVTDLAAARDNVVDISTRRGNQG